MKPNPILIALLIAVATPTLHAQEGGAAKPPAIVLTAEGLNQRYEFVGNLIERSSSARQIERSGTPESRQLQQQAKEARGRVKAALAAGNLEQADALLRDAVQSMIKAVRLAHPEEVTGDKLRNDFNNRRDSVKALLATGQRVAGEKGTARPEFAKAEGLLKEAEALAAANKIAEGRVQLDAAYLLIKDAVRGMRGGEELLADKNFATKADEYKYEQARNDDYQGLIAGLIKDQTDPSWAEAAQKARRLRDEADGIGKSGDFDAALQKIGESTNQLKSILRRAGFPII